MEKIDFEAMASTFYQDYLNTVISNVNDHIVRLAIMTRQYPWHKHPNSDETFIGVEGTVIIETFSDKFELTPGSCITIPQNVEHRTRPKNLRSVNLTIERTDIDTIYLEV